MKESTRKLITWVVLGVAALATVLSIVFAMNNGGVKELEAVKANGMFDATFWILVCLIAVSLGAILLFLVMKLAKNFKERPGYAGKFFLLVGVIALVCIASFLLSSGNDVSQALMEKHNVTEGTSKLIGAACWMVYILVIAAAVAIVYSEIAKSLKK